jgi:hypothetical protein
MKITQGGNAAPSAGHLVNYIAIAPQGSNFVKKKTLPVLRKQKPKSQLSISCVSVVQCCHMSENC